MIDERKVPGCVSRSALTDEDTSKEPAAARTLYSVIVDVKLERNRCGKRSHRLV